MQYQLTAPSLVKATIQLPASKSISNRALIIHALARPACQPTTPCQQQAHPAESSLVNLSDCDDTQVMIKALSGQQEVIDILAAGTAMRFLTAYLSVTPGVRTLTGTQRMQQRPIQILVNALRQLGAQIEYIGKEGFPPLRISGTEPSSNHHHPSCNEITLKGNVSSQYISALLMIGPMLGNGLRVQLTGEIISRPYINLTLQLMKDFGASAAWQSDNSIRVAAQPYHDVPFTVESDWSGASYWYQIVALADEAEVELKGLFDQSYQGDSRGAEIFARLGVETEFTGQGVRLRKTSRNPIATATPTSPASSTASHKSTPTSSPTVCPTAPARFDEDFIDIPDLAQTFVVTCALLNIPFRFTGLQSLKIKETDRIAALKAEMRKLGYVLHDQDDSILLWDGERCSPEATPVICTYEDHRMAMAFAPAVLRLPQIRIDEPAVVSKSYPRYWEDLQQAGFTIQPV